MIGALLVGATRVEISVESARMSRRNASWRMRRDENELTSDCRNGKV